MQLRDQSHTLVQHHHTGVEPMCGSDHEAAFGVSADVVLVQVGQHYVEEVLKVLQADVGLDSRHVGFMKWAGMSPLGCFKGD